MAGHTIVAPTERDRQALEDSNVDAKANLQDAQDGDASDRSLTLKEALKKYKKAVTWAVILSTSLIMEGYDVVIVRRRQPHQTKSTRRRADLAI